MAKSIMILGAGVMQIPAILAAKELSLYTLAADGSACAPARDLADEFAHIDLKDRDGLLQCAQEFAQSHDLIGVFTAGTDFSANVAYIAQHCHLPGHSYQAALNASNKALMRACLAQHHVPSPRFLDIHSSSDLQAQMKTIHSWAQEGADFPVLVAKPADNMGSRGVCMVRSARELENAVHDALQYSPTSHIIIEEYMDGRELSVDALVYDNEIIICGIADRYIYYPPYFVERGHTLPSALGQDVLDEVRDVFKQGVRALGLSHGAAKGDIKVTGSGVKIGEIAARLSGGYMSGWTYPYASGVNLTKNAMLLAIGQKPQALQPARPLQTCAEWSFISIPGKINAILYQDQARKTEHVKEMFIRVKAGDMVCFPRNNVEKCGNFIAVHSDRKTAEQAARQAAGRIFLRLEAGNAETSAFLFEEDSPPSPLENTENACDFNGLTIEQIQERFKEITGCAFEEIPAAKQRHFHRAAMRGGLQGAVWYYDTFIGESP